MYKLMIIDDEKEQVEGIKNSIDWNEYEIEVISVAYNGKEGLALVKENQPDMAIIDIQMPHMNGLMLIKEIRNLEYPIEMIILSGHDNFEYAKKAIHLQVNNYLLKPCSTEEILQAVLRAKNNVIEEHKKREMTIEYHSFFDQYVKLFRDKLLRDLLENKLRNATTFFEDAKKYQIHLQDAEACTAVFRFENIEQLYTVNSNESFDFLMIQISEFLKQKPSPFDSTEIVIKDDDIVFISAHHPFSMDLFKEYIQQINDELSDQFEYSFIVGIGKNVLSPIVIHKSYNQALTAIDHNVFLGEQKLSIYDSYMSEHGFQYLYPFFEEKAIFQSIELGDVSLIEQNVRNFFDHFDQELDLNSSYIKKVGITLLNSIFKFCSDKNIDSQELNHLIFNSIDQIHQAKSFDMLKNEIISVLKEIIDYDNNQTNNKFIQRALNYIQAHVTDDINLKTISSELSITPAYFSFLFKQKMKINFVDYLNQYRIDLAKELLKDVRLKNYEVAFQVGYQDEKYFYKLFKRITGLTPSQYRDSHHINRVKR